jgi:uncharacterized membrane protein
MAENFLTEAQKKQIIDAIGKAEKGTNGEIRVHIERRCNEDVLDHAAFIFEKLEMHKTAERSGVLFYVSFEDHKLAILGDAGINAKVPSNFWDKIKDHLIFEFKNGNYATGLSEAILMAGEQLTAHFPKTENNPNELSNEISFGKK